MALHSDTQCLWPTFQQPPPPPPGPSSSVLAALQWVSKKYWHRGLPPATGTSSSISTSHPRRSTAVWGSVTSRGWHHTGQLSTATDWCCLAHPSQIAVSWAPGGLPKGLGLRHKEQRGPHEGTPGQGYAGGTRSRTQVLEMGSRVRVGGGAHWDPGEEEK